MNLNKYFFNQYQLLSNNNVPSILGLGTYGTVQLAIHKETQKYFAIKKIPRKLAYRQSSIHSTLNHQNIVKLVQTFYDFDKQSTFLVLQYVQNGNFDQFIKQKFPINILQICKIFKGICQGLINIHNNSIIHGDIKSSNILLNKQNKVKLCDFGTAKTFEQNETNIFGTFQYLAPQILLKKHYDYKIDIWAMGVILYEVIEGQLPYKQKNISIRIEKMKQPLKFKNKISKNLTELIRKILSFNAKQRPQLIQIIEYLNKIQAENQKIREFQKTVQKQKIRFKTVHKSEQSTIDQIDQSKNEKIQINKPLLLKNYSSRLLTRNCQQIKKYIPKYKIFTKPSFIQNNNQHKKINEQNKNHSSKISIKNLMLLKKK